MIISTPKLRFKEFTHDWTQGSLHDLLVVSKKRNQGNRYGKDDVFSVSGEFGIVNQIQFQGRSFAGVSVSNYHIVEHNDIVYTKSPLKANPFGIIKYNPNQPGIVSTLYAVYGPKKNTCPKFLDYYFQLDDNVNRYLRPLVHKGPKNDMKINNSHVLDGSFYVTSYAEQLRIVNFLTAVDDKITIIANRLALLQRYKRGVLQQIFTRQLQFNKDDGIESYPDWTSAPLGELVDKVGDSFNPVTSKETFRSIELESLDQGTGRLLSTFDASGQKSVKTKFKKGDVLFGKLRPYLRKFYYADFDGVSTSEIWVLRGKLIENAFLYFLVQTEQFNMAANIQSGSKMPRADWGIVSREVFAIPSIEEQSKIANFLFSIDNKITLEENMLCRAKDFKKSLLQQIFV